MSHRVAPSLAPRRPPRLAPRRPLRRPLGCAATAAILLLLPVLGAGSSDAAAQEPSPLDRIEALDVERLQLGRMTVLYSAADGSQAIDPPAAPSDGSQRASQREAAARRAVRPFEAAGDFVAEALGGDFTFTVALLGPRDWNRVGQGLHAIPWASTPDRLVVVPVRSDIGLLQPGRDSVRARKVLDVIALHQLGHVAAGRYLYPAGYRSRRPPVRWFEELMASYLAQAYLRERQPDLADFVEELARDVMGRAEPRFTSLEQLDRYHDSYLSAPQGANTLGWYQNMFNRRAAELYDELGLDFVRRVRQELPWIRFENWTTESLLNDLEKIHPGFLAWAEEIESLGRPRF